MTMVKKQIWGISDADGTLIDSDPFIFSSLASRFNEIYASDLKREISTEEFTRIAHGHAREGICTALSTALQIKVDYPTLFDRREEIMQDLFRKNGVPLAPFVVPALTQIRDRGVGLVVATQSPATRIRVAMDSTPEGQKLANLFLDYFDTLARRQKPAPDVYNAAMHAVGADPANCFSLEDSVTGMQAARAAELNGVKMGLVVGYTGLYPKPREQSLKLYDAGADLVIHDMRDLPPAVFKHYNL